MTLAELAQRVAELPERIRFEWGGPENWHKDVFAREVKTLPEAIAYIDQLRGRMHDYAFALDDLGNAYEKMRAVLLSFNIEKQSENR